MSGFTFSFTSIGPDGRVNVRRFGNTNTGSNQDDDFAAGGFPFGGVFGPPSAQMGGPAQGARESDFFGGAADGPQPRFLHLLQPGVHAANPFAASLQVMLQDLLEGGGMAGSQHQPQSVEQMMAQLFAAHEPQAQPAARSAVERLPAAVITADDVRNKVACSVCMEEFKQGEPGVVALPGCGHKYHLEDCLKPWLREHHTCPVCRAPLPTAAEAGEPPQSSSSAAAAAGSAARPAASGAGSAGGSASSGRDGGGSASDGGGGGWSFSGMISNLVHRLAGGQGSGNSNSAGGSSTGASSGACGGIEVGPTGVSRVRRHRSDYESQQAASGAGSGGSGGGSASWSSAGGDPFGRRVRPREEDGSARIFDDGIRVRAGGSDDVIGGGADVDIDEDEESEADLQAREAAELAAAIAASMAQEEGSRPASAAAAAAAAAPAAPPARTSSSWGAPSSVSAAASVPSSSSSSSSSSAMSAGGGGDDNDRALTSALLESLTSLSLPELQAQALSEGVPIPPEMAGNRDYLLAQLGRKIGLQIPLPAVSTSQAAAAPASSSSATASSGAAPPPLSTMQAAAVPRYSVPPEPPASDPDAFTLKLRLPSGRSLIRRFRGSDSMGQVAAAVTSAAAAELGGAAILLRVPQVHEPGSAAAAAAAGGSAEDSSRSDSNAAAAAAPLRAQAFGPSEWDTPLAAAGIARRAQLLVERVEG